MNVAIEDADGEITVGETAAAEVGQIITVNLHDENGMPIKVTGKVVELLD